MIYAIAYGNKHYKVKFPQNWNECSQRQLVRLSALLTSGVAMDIAVVKALKILLNKSMFAFAFMPADVKQRLVEKTNWVFDKNTLTQNLLPKYKGLYGPKSNLANCIFKEVHACEMQYRMALDNVPGAVDKLIAVLYREKKLFYNTTLDAAGDLRKPYNGNTVQYRATKIKQWPQPVKDAILLFYDGCRQHFIAANPAVFSGGEADAEDQFHGMFLMMRNLAADGKYGDFDKVEQLPFYTALYEATILIQDAAEASQTVDNE